MNILQVIPYFTPKRGGDVNVVYNLSKGLKKMGHNVTIATTDFEFDGEYANSLEGIDVIPFKCLVNVGLMLFSPGMKKWLKEEIGNFDIIHLHDFRSYQNNIVYRYSKKFSIPYVLQPHASTPRMVQKKRLKWLYDRFFGYDLMQGASVVIAVSDEESKHDIEMGANTRKLSVVYNGMDIEKYNDLPQNGEFKSKYGINDKIILYLGRIHKLKGIDFAIKAFSELVKEMDNIVFVIAGSDDGYKSELEKLIDELDLRNKVIFTGYVEEADKLSAYVDADLFVHTVLYMGGVGIAPFESILCNTPVIVTGGCGELIKEIKCGYLVKYGDVNELKEKMKYVFDHQNKAKQLVENGKNYIHENLAWDDVVGKIEKLYSEIVTKV